MLLNRVLNKILYSICQLYSKRQWIDWIQMILEVNEVLCHDFREVYDWFTLNKQGLNM